MILEYLKKKKKEASFEGFLGGIEKEGRKEKVG